MFRELLVQTTGLRSHPIAPTQTRPPEVSKSQDLRPGGIVGFEGYVIVRAGAVA